MGNAIHCVRCGTPKIELFYVIDGVWLLAGFKPSDIACISCTEKGLQRPLGVPDLAPFPWGGMNRPVYFRGIVDGAGGTTTAAHAINGEYQAGVSLGKHLAANSTPDEIKAFVAANT